MEWKTAITKVEPDRIQIRGYDIQDIIRNFSFGQAVYLLFKGEPPSEAAGRMIDAILVATIDHSVMAPSACATRFVASGGAPIQSAVAAGLQALGDHHGGAIEQCQRLLEDGVSRARSENKGIDEMAETILREHKEAKKRIPGYGHPYHKADPRTEALFSLAEELDFSGDHISLAKALGEKSESVIGRHLVINTDAAQAAVLAEMGFPWQLARGFFLVSRAAGLSAHAYEEYTRERPFRAVDLESVNYDGSENLNLEKK
jgi:citrate synthase